MLSVFNFRQSEHLVCFIAVLIFIWPSFKKKGRSAVGTGIDQKVAASCDIELRF